MDRRCDSARPCGRRADLRSEKRRSQAAGAAKLNFHLAREPNKVNIVGVVDRGLGIPDDLDLENPPLLLRTLPAGERSAYIGRDDVVCGGA
jgi:hypothetical protein